MFPILVPIHGNEHDRVDAELLHNHYNMINAAKKRRDDFVATHKIGDFFTINTKRMRGKIYVVNNITMNHVAFGYFDPSTEKSSKSYGQLAFDSIELERADFISKDEAFAKFPGLEKIDFNV